MKEFLFAFRGCLKVALCIFFIAISVWATIEQATSLTLMVLLLSFVCETPTFTSTIDDIRLAKYQVRKYFYSRKVASETVQKGSGSIPDSI